ncbi:MAG: hypothetical protein ACR2QJ_10605 [Geminicoccaceae bacterium]
MASSVCDGAKSRSAETHMMSSSQSDEALSFEPNDMASPRSLSTLPTLLIGAFLVGAPAVVQEAQSVPGQLDNGLASVMKAAPPATKVFDYQGDIDKRTALLGDFGEIRENLHGGSSTPDYETSCLMARSSIR